MKIISVHDIVAQAYLMPQTVRTTEEAIRMFSNSCKDPNSNFAKNPSDFVLVELATWNELDGSIQPYAKPTVLASASQYIQ